MKKLVIGIVLILSLVVFAFAQTENESCNIEFNPVNTADLIESIPLINSQLSSCDVSLPEQIKSLLNNKNILVSINMNSGSTESFYLSIVDGMIDSLSSGMPEDYSYNITLGENTLDGILASENMMDSLLLALDNGEIVVDPVGVWNNVVWFFANLFI